MTTETNTPTAAPLAWTKTGTREYVSEIDTGTRKAPCVIRGVDDLYFMSLDGNDCGYEHRLGDAKAWFQQTADRVAKAAAREAAKA